MNSKLFFATTALCLLFGGMRSYAADAPANNQNQAQTKKPPVSLRVNPAFCAQMVAYQEPAGVEYQPGVDVHGKPVAPADINPPSIAPDVKSFSFPLNIDLAEYLGIAQPAGIEGKMNLGTIGYENGHVTFNGTPVGGKAEAAMEDLCRQQAQPSKPSDEKQEKPSAAPSP